LADISSQTTIGTSKNPLNLARPAAAKTGQVADGSEVWSVGYTPQRVSVVWLGHPSTEGQRLDPLMAAGLWRSVMLMANEGLPVAGWQQPAGITKLRVCDPSGLLPTTICPAIVEDIFLNGQEPLALDDLYQSLQVNRETNRLATAFTPLEMIDTKTYLIVPQDAKGWAQSAGLPQPPTDYDLIQTAPENPDATITSPQMSACLRGTITIGGTARSSQFSGYRVEVGQGINPQTWTLVSPAATSPFRMVSLQPGIQPGWMDFTSSG